jgi:hypothetical protein
MPCCFDDPDVPAFWRLGFIVKQVCVSGRTTYVTDSEKPAGVTLNPPSDGYVTRVIPTAIPARFPRLICNRCGKPEKGRAFVDNCTHKEKILGYEVNLDLAKPDVVTLYYEYYAQKAREWIKKHPTEKLPEPLIDSVFDKDGLDTTVDEKRKFLLEASEKPYIVKGKTVKMKLKAHYIPFGMTEQGSTRTVKFPNMYHPNSEINCIQYQLNEHIEFHNRSC